MIAYLRARSLGGKVIMRMEDLDHPKDKPGAAAQAIEDLKWLGFDWDEEYVQSERKPLYAAATKALFEAGHIYPCVCSRRDVETAQSAPHAGEQLYYPGTCRDRFSTWSEAAECKRRFAVAGDDNKRTTTRTTTAVQPSTSNLQPASPCWRFRVPEGTVVEFDDVFAGHCSQDVAATLGDFPLARDEGGAGYTLAAVYDDLAMGVTEVVRGDDLLAATPAQLLLARALLQSTNLRISESTNQNIDHRCPPPPFFSTYLHVPLVTGPDGKRLAKRHGDTRVATFREQGIPPERVLGFLAASCGWCREGEAISLAGLLPRFDLGTVPHRPFTVRKFF